MKEDFVNTHKRIMSALREIVEKNNNGVIKISTLANVANADTRTVRKHLEIGQIHNIGKFIDNDKTIFCVRIYERLFDDDQ